MRRLAATKSRTGLSGGAGTGTLQPVIGVGAARGVGAPTARGAGTGGLKKRSGASSKRVRGNPSAWAPPDLL